MFAKKTDIKSLGRLKKRSDFLWVQAQVKKDIKIKNGTSAQKWASKSMVIEMSPNQERGKDLGVRYGLTVSKRVSKLAVTRNRVKRRLKAVACDVLPEYEGHDIDVVLIGRVGAQERDYKDLQQDLRWCLKKLEIMPKAGADEKAPD